MSTFYSKHLPPSTTPVKSSSGYNKLGEKNSTIALIAGNAELCCFSENRDTPPKKTFFFYCSLTIYIETYYVGNTFFKGEFKYILGIELCPTNHVGHSTVTY